MATLLIYIHGTLAVYVWTALRLSDLKHHHQQHISNINEKVFPNKHLWTKHRLGKIRKNVVTLFRVSKQCFRWSPNTRMWTAGSYMHGKVNSAWQSKMEVYIKWKENRSTEKLVRIRLTHKMAATILIVASCFAYSNTWINFYAKFGSTFVVINFVKPSRVCDVQNKLFGRAFWSIWWTNWIFFLYCRVLIGCDTNKWLH
jgi:hypothetical protein